MPFAKIPKSALSVFLNITPPYGQVSKAEARIARQAAKKLRHVEKSVRMKERPDFAEARTAIDISERSVRTGANPGSIFGMQVQWTTESADRDGAWESGTARQWADECWKSVIYPKLEEFGKLTWGEIDQFITGGKDRHKMHHNMEVDILADEAQYRLLELDKHGDIIFRFRLAAKKRLWGFRIVNKFELLWYDPEHEIYPTDPD
jgi:hypothetical protein